MYKVMLYVLNYSDLILFSEQLIHSSQNKDKYYTTYRLFFSEYHSVFCDKGLLSKEF